ncbi:MAG TPA: alpha/beta hydrolase [Acidimicrobiales bacterium]|nr:alpha/beta hydrolase [Acidimicrobiales bacterium]
MSTPSSQVKARVEAAHVGPPMWERSVETLRKQMHEESVAGGGEPERVWSIDDVEVGGVRTRLYLPHPAPHAVFVWLHGGGWMLGDLDCYDAVACAIANLVGCAVASVDYRLAPEHRFPAAIDDAWEVTARMPRDFDLVAVGGDSAGGNLAAAVALRSVAAGMSLALQVLVYPVLTTDLDNPGYQEFLEQYADFLGVADFGQMSRRSLQYIWDSYVPSPADRLKPDAAPLRARSLRGSPPALLIAAEHDILRVDTEEYHRRLGADGVPVQMLTYQGQVHGFYNLLAAVDDAKGAISATASRLRSAFMKPAPPRKSELPQETACPK